MMYNHSRLALFTGLFGSNVQNLVLAINSNVTYQNIKGWEAESDVIEWEKSAIEAWGNTPDCSPDTGICSNCGVGAIVIELKDDEHGNLIPSYRTYSVGAGNTKSPWDYNTKSFETASYTKVITALTMQVQIEEGSVNPESTIQQYLPECDWDSALSSEVATITLDELRLQTSGLPAQPPNRADTGTPDGNPFGGYTIDMLCTSLENIAGLPTRGRFSYSNYAFGMLGFLLTRAEQEANPYLYPNNEPPSYEELVKSKVLNPMGMDNTVVDFDLGTAAVGCSRGLKRDEPTIRIGKYGILQGNGALRSTLPDMGNFIEALILAERRNQQEQGASSSDLSSSLRGTPVTTRDADLLYPEFPFLNEPTDEDSTSTTKNSVLLKALETCTDTGDVDEACTCVSGWCEGWLCPLPNPIHEQTTLMGATTFTSALKKGHRKSGDTGGYSLRGVWSYEKRRGAFAVDTCGGCGQRGTSGSAVQRLALLLADGPPPTHTFMSNDDDDDDRNPSTRSGNQSDDDSSSLSRRRFVGESSSHAFPSNTKLEVEVRRQPGIDGAAAVATVLVASSDGQGCASPAIPLFDDDDDDGRIAYYELEHSALLGCGWSSGRDPLVDDVRQSRKLIILSNGLGAVYQEMGVDVYLSNANNKDDDEDRNHNNNSGDEYGGQQQSSDGEKKSDNSSAYTIQPARHGGVILMLSSLVIPFFFW